ARPGPSLFLPLLTLLAAAAQQLEDPGRRARTRSASVLCSARPSNSEMGTRITAHALNNRCQSSGNIFRTDIRPPRSFGPLPLGGPAWLCCSNRSTFHV